MLFHASTPRIPPTLRRDQLQWETKPTRCQVPNRVESSRASRIMQWKYVLSEPVV